MVIRKTQLKQLKDQLALNNISTFLPLLQKELTLQDLHMIREQKLLLKIRDLEKQAEVAEAYKEAARRTQAAQGDIHKAELYADFTICVLRVFEQITSDVKKYSDLLQIFSLLELMEVLDIVLFENLQHVSNTFTSRITTASENESFTNIESAEITEFIMHQQHGRVNDLYFAGARVLNLIAEFSNKELSGRRKEIYSKKGQTAVSTLKKGLLQLIGLGIYWNTLEYTLDKVSYGEWYVSDLKMIDRPEVKFNFTDLKLYRTRQIGIRREVIKRKFYKKKPRWLSQSLQDFITTSFDAALEYYENSTRTGAFSRKDYLEIRSVLLQWLEHLDAQDELLWALGGKEHRILTDYLAAIALRSFSLAARFLIQHLPKDKGRALITPRIPIDKIVNLILEVLPIDLTPEVKRNIVRDSVISQTVSLPTNRYFDIIYKSYFRIGLNEVVGLRTFINDNWTPIVRSSLIKGGELARLYGQIWEMYISDIIKGCGWLILGKGIKIRKNKQILTDIDILAFKDEVLLIIQVKVIAGGGFNAYEHWKAYNTIMKGVDQAAIAELALRDDACLTNSLFASNHVRQAARVIQPVVITTSPLFNGWTYKSVPIVGGDHFLSLFHGAKLTYKTADGNIIEHTEHQGEEPTVKQFLQELHTPFLWNLAKESNEVEYIVDEFPHIKVSIPELKRDSPMTTGAWVPFSLHNSDKN